MLDAPPAPDLALRLAPGDGAAFVACCDPTARTGRREAFRLHVVLHRGHGLRTHACRVVPDRRPGDLARRPRRRERRAAPRAWLACHAAEPETVG